MGGDSTSTITPYYQALESLGIILGLEIAPRIVRDSLGRSLYPSFIGTVFRFTMLAQGLSEAKLLPKSWRRWLYDVNHAKKTS